MAVRPEKGRPCPLTFCILHRCVHMDVHAARFRAPLLLWPLCCMGRSRVVVVYVAGIQILGILLFV